MAAIADDLSRVVDELKATAPGLMGIHAALDVIVGKLRDGVAPVTLAAAEMPALELNPDVAAGTAPIPADARLMFGQPPVDDALDPDDDAA